MAGVVKQLAGGGSGQSLRDRVTAAKHSISGAGLAKAVCKATTEELLAPKRKHLQFLIDCTNECNVSIPELANELLERLRHPNWVVVFKTLISMHNLMNYGNERFTQYLASNNCSFALLNFSDKSSVQGADMSRFICRYSAYIQEKAIAYRVNAFDFCKVKRGADDALLRTLSPEKLLKAMVALIAQFDALLGFDATANELTNAVINAAFMLLYKDASRLFVVFNDGIINLLSKFFETMNKKQCREGLEIYKKFIARSERLNGFSKVAEHAGIERADLTRLEKHPASFLEAMESHLAHLEGRKFPRSGSSNSLGSAGGASATSPVEAPKLSQLLMEEQQQLDKLKAEQMQRKSATAPATAVAVAPPPPKSQPPAIVVSSAGAAPIGNQTPAAPLLVGSGGPAGFVPQASAVIQQQQQQQQLPQQQQQSAFFANFPPSNAPAANYGFDPFGTVLQPISANQSVPSNLSGPGATAAPAAASAGAGKSGGAGGLTGDLDSSLASLMGNLNMRQGQQQHGKQTVNWGIGTSAASSTSQSSASFSAAGSAAASAAAAAAAAPRTTGVKIAAGPTINWGHPGASGHQAYPATSGYGAQPMGFLHTQSQPAFRMSPNQQQQATGWNQPANQPNSNDPFGAL